MGESLLEKAKQLRRKSARTNVNKEHFDLFLAWVKDEVGLKQVCHALSINYDGKALTYLATIAKESYYKKFWKQT